MEKQECLEATVCREIGARTGGEILIGVVGPYKTENFYALLSARKEAQPIAKQQKGRKARRQKA